MFRAPHALLESIDLPSANVGSTALLEISGWITSATQAAAPLDTLLILQTEFVSKKILQVDAPSLTISKEPDVFFNAILDSSPTMLTVFVSHALQIVELAPARLPAPHVCQVSICLEPLVCFQMHARELWSDTTTNASLHAHLELPISTDSV